MADESIDQQPPDFQTIGQGIAAGMDAAGVALKNATMLERAFVNGLMIILGWLASSVGWIAAKIVRACAESITVLDPAFGEIAKAGLEALFGISVPASSFSQMNDRAAREGVRLDVGRQMLTALTGLAGAEGGGALEPSLAPAEKYLGTIAGFAIEGWLMGIVVELESLNYLEHFGDIKDTVAEMFGFGRLTRRILTPIINATIVEPARWSVNKTYRPTLMSAQEAIRHTMRGYLDEAARNEIIARHGLNDAALDAMIFQERKYLSAADADLLVRMEAWTREDAIQELRDSGHEQDRAERLYALEEAKQVRKFALEVATSAEAAFVDYRIDEPLFLSIVHDCFLDEPTKERIVTTGQHKRSVNVKHLSRNEVEQAVELEVLSVTDYRAWLDAHGYAHDDAITLELMLQARLAKADEARKTRAAATAERAAAKAAKDAAIAAKRDALHAEHADFSGTLAQAERLVVRGLMPALFYARILVDHGVTPGDAGELAQLAQQDADAFTAAAARRAQLAKKSTTPELAIGTLEAAVRKGTMTVAQFDAALTARKFSSEDIATLNALLERELADLAAAEKKRAEAEARLASKSLSLGEVESAVLAGVQTLDQFRAFLTTQKFSAGDVATLVDLLSVKLKDAKLAQAKRDAAAAKLAGAQISLANEERAVRDGIVSMNAYQAFLSSHGFTADDIATLTALLNDQIAKDKTAAAAHAKATGLLGAKGLSLSEIDAATVAGVLTVAQYRDFLVRNAFTAADADLLVAILTPKVAAAAEAAARAKALGVEPGDKTATYNQVRKAVLDGVQTIDYFDQWLQANSYTDADRALLVEDATVQLAAKATAAATKGKATTKLAAKNLSLSEMQQAVKDGLRTLDEYGAFLTAQGFAAQDVAILVDELAQQLPAPAPAP